MAPWKEVRCRGFNKSGDPIGKGCDRSDTECRFIHPSDFQWSAFSRRPRSRSPPPRRPYTSQPKSRSPRGRRRSSPRSLRSSEFPRPSPNDTKGSPRLPDHPPNIAPSHLPELSRSPNIPDTLVPLRGPKNLDIDQSPNKESPLFLPQSQSTEASQPQVSISTTTMPPPMAPPAHSAVPSTTALSPKPTNSPPVVQVVPTQVQQLTREDDSKDKASPEEKRKVWVTRIKLMTDCCAARAEHMKWEKDVYTHRRMMNQCSDGETRRNIEQSLSNASQKCDKLKAEMNRTVQELLKLDEFWPLLTNSDNGSSKDALEQLRGDVAQLKGFVAEVKRQTEDAQVSSTTEQDSVAGTKRKRSLTNEGEPSSNRVTKTIEHFEDRIKDLEYRADEQQNEVLQREDEITAQLIEKIDEKIEELSETWTYTTGHTKKQLKQLAKSRYEQSEIISAIEVKLDTTAALVTELQKEVDQVKAKTLTLEQESTRLLKEKLEYDADIAKMQERLLHNQEVIDRMGREVAALTATVQAHAARLAQPSSPPPPSAEEILAVMEGPMEARLQRILEPILLQHSAEINQMLIDQNETLSKGVWGKLSVTLQFTEMIYAWMQRNNNPNILESSDISRI